MRRGILAVCTLLAACGGTSERPEPAPQEDRSVSLTRGAPIEIPRSREREEIARLEDARSLGDGRLLELLAEDEDPGVRARAATALGRFPFPRFGSEVTAALARALEDRAPAVRETAAFALGVRGDPASVGTLLAYRNHPDAALRARVVEAVSRMGDASVHAQVALSLRDPDLSVRMEAAVGAGRWDRSESTAAEVDRALLDALRPYRIGPEGAPKTAVEAELVWRILWALGRRRAELGRGAFMQYSDAAVTLERLFALRGLGQLAPDPAALGAAIAAVRGPGAAKDWRVAYEAVVTIGRLAAEGTPDEAVLAALGETVEHPSAHVRAGTMEALGRIGDGKGVPGLLQRGRLDVSASVRAASLRARVHIAEGAGNLDDALDELVRGARDDDPVVRAAAADAAGTLEDGRGSEVLLALVKDPSVFVATRAVEALGEHPSDAVRAELHGQLASDDNGMRLAAVLALKKMPDPSDVPALAEAYRTSQGDVAAEVGFNALQVLAAIGTEDARRVVSAAQADTRPHVRAVARQLVVDVLGGTPVADEPAFDPGTDVPILGEDELDLRFNPMVEVRTSRGTMVFELFPLETPVHVHSFLNLVEEGHYDGLTFHRVVPDFVIQGGDYRGDGNGARPWEGDALRAEFTPRKYTRGSLGMPRNEDPDSGGSQFFVTHLPTPHLDGRYTLFGELRAGGEVLDRIEVGDRILGARVLR